MSLAPIIPKSRFIGGDDRAYLYTAAEGLAPLSVIDATRRYYENKVQGASGRQAHVEVERECRTGLARLMGADPEEIALLGSASEGINAIYSLIDWRPGDNVVIPVDDLEFPSVVLPAVRRERDGTEIRRVSHDGWVVTPEAIAQAVDERTRLVFLSHVSYRTGYRFDLERVAELIRKRNPDTLIAVDATQSLGVVPVPARACDFLIATTCKWLLGPHGLGIFFWNRKQRPEVEPAGIGWYSVVDGLRFPYELKPDAGRFELGGPNLLGIYALNEGVRLLLDIGVEWIEERVLSLTGTLLERLRASGLDLMTADEPAQRAGIVAWLDPACSATAANLAEQGIVVTGSSGRIRVAFHIYNDEGDIERLAVALGTGD